MDNITAAVRKFIIDNNLNVDAILQRDVLRLTVQTLMDAEISGIVNADHYERASKRRTYRNGYRASNWDSPIGSLPLDIPKLRSGTYHPDFLYGHDAIFLDLVLHAVANVLDAATITRFVDKLKLQPLPRHANVNLAQDVKRLLAVSHHRATSYRYVRVGVEHLPDVPAAITAVTGTLSDGSTNLLALLPQYSRDSDEFLMRLLANQPSNVIAECAAQFTYRGDRSKAILVPFPKGGNVVSVSDSDEIRLRLLTQIWNLLAADITVATPDLVVLLDDEPIRIATPPRRPSHALVA